MARPIMSDLSTARIDLCIVKHHKSSHLRLIEDREA